MRLAVGEHHDAGELVPAWCPRSFDVQFELGARSSGQQGARSCSTRPQQGQSMFHHYMENLGRLHWLAIIADEHHNTRTLVISFGHMMLLSIPPGIGTHNGDLRSDTLNDGRL